MNRVSFSASSDIPCYFLPDSLETAPDIRHSENIENQSHSGGDAGEDDTSHEDGGDGEDEDDPSRSFQSPNCQVEPSRDHVPILPLFHF